MNHTQIPEAPGDLNRRWRAATTARDAMALAAALRDPSIHIARAAIRRITELDPPWGSAVLRGALFSADISVVEDLAKALNDVNDPLAFELASSGLHEEPYTHRVAGAVTLGVLGGQQGVPALQEALHDPIAAVRLAAARALNKLPDHEDAAQRGMALLSDPSGQVRAAAVTLIVRDHPAPAGVLHQLIADDDQLVRLELARHAGALLDDDVLQLLADPDDGVRAQATRCAGTPFVQALGELLTGDRSIDVRRAAARTLGAIGDGAAVDALLYGIEDHDSLVRICALNALEHALTRSGVVARLADELLSERARRRKSSIYSLARLPGANHGQVIWRLADDPNVDVRLAVVATAEVLLADSESLLTYMSTDPDTAVREGAKRRLERANPNGWRGPPAPLPHAPAGPMSD